MNNSIFFWHHFEQNEARCVSKMKLEYRKISFNTLTNIVDTVSNFEIISYNEIEWMRNRLEEIAEEFPELISNER